MHFAFTEEQAMIAETVGGFFAEHATSERTREAMADGSGCDRELWRAFASELGLAGVALPEADGGAGLGQVELAIIAEAAGRYVAAIPLLSGIALSATAIATGGSDTQRAEWLPGLLSGEKVAAFADGAGFREEGSRVSGAAPFVPHGGIADLFVVTVGDRLALVPRDAAGARVTPQVTMDQTRPLARLELENVAAELLPREARDAALAAGRVALAADALGGAEACLERTVGYAKERVQFGRPIGGFQAIKHRLADMMVEIEQARSAVYWAACAIDEGAADAAIAVHAAKTFATDTYADCAGAMIQLHGGIAFTWEHDAHLFFKRAQADRTLLGTPEWHREQIAQAIGLDRAA